MHQPLAPCPFTLSLGKAKRLLAFLFGCNYFPLQQADLTFLFPTSLVTPAPQLTLPSAVQDPGYYAGNILLQPSHAPFTFIFNQRVHLCPRNVALTRLAPYLLREKKLFPSTPFPTTLSQIHHH